MPGARRRILVVDIGGHNIKLWTPGAEAPRKLPSGPTLTPRRMATAVSRAAADWKYDVVAIGYPGAVVHEAIAKEPANLGRGWMHFDFAHAFGCPVRIVNDAAMQALGSYRGGRMLFLGLGTGLGAALILDGTVGPLEIAHLPYKRGHSYEDVLGKRGLDRMGKTRWLREVETCVALFLAAFQVDEVVLGGGNAKRIKHPPTGARLGDNDLAFAGGLRLWQDVRAGARRR